jgi:hypothetical protein
MDGRLTDRIRGRVVNDDGTTYTSANGASGPWEDVLLTRHIVDDQIVVQVWGKAVEHPQLVADHTHPTNPRYVWIAAIPGGDIHAVPRKGRQRALILPDGSSLAVHTMKNCCGSPYRDFRP